MGTLGRVDVSSIENIVLLIGGIVNVMVLMVN
jgi:hypothetical protein